MDHRSFKREFFTSPRKIRPLKSRTYRKLPSQMAASEWKGERQAFAFVMRGLSVMSRTSFLNRNFHSDGSGLTADVKRANRSERNVGIPQNG
jgi:hypothetical protein